MHRFFERYMQINNLFRPAASAATALTFVLLCDEVSASTMMEMQIISTITPAACTPMLSGGGVVDYGSIPARTLKPGAITALPAESLSFTIHCDASAKVSVRAIDNRTSSVIAGIVSSGSGNGTLNDSFNFGLGMAAGRGIGGYAIIFRPTSFTGDYQQAQLLFSTDNGATWQQSKNGFVAKNQSIGWAIAGGNNIASWRNISGTLTVQPYLNKPENLPLSQDIFLNGSATIELSYL